MEDMAIDPSLIKTPEDVEEKFGHYKSFEKYQHALNELGKMDIVAITKYVVLLYSQDTILNQNPPLSFAERQRSAGTLAKLAQVGGKFTKGIQQFIFEMENRYIFSFIFEYLTRDKKHLWMDIIVLETQMMENQRLRMRPVSEDKGKDELTAFQSKDKLMEMYKGWRKQLGEYYDEFYGDNQKIRAIHKMNRANMAIIENYATL
jgi:hypothetical protein